MEFWGNGSNNWVIIMRFFGDMAKILKSDQFLFLG